MMLLIMVCITICHLVGGAAAVLGWHGIVGRWLMVLFACGSVYGIALPENLFQAVVADTKVAHQHDCHLTVVCLVDLSF
jgi:Ni,Fe-hydrogenase I cytochrome b subunit